MTKLGDRPTLLPEDGAYSIDKIDTWKSPQDDDFAYKVGEISSLDEGPLTTAGRGESVLVLDADGNSVSVTDGPEDPTASTVRDNCK